MGDVMGSLKHQAQRGRQFAWDARDYRRNRRRHLGEYAPDAARAPDPAVQAALVRDGVAVVSGFLGREAVDRIVTEVRQDVEALAQGRYDGPLRTRALSEAGLYRMYEVDEAQSPASRAFFSSPYLQALADSLCRDGMHSADRYVDFKTKVGGWDESVDYHIDHWKLRFKAFLLLQDVTADHAPFRYVVGSHRDAAWRERWEWAYQRKGSAGAVLPQSTVDRVRRHHGLEERTYTGRAGDLLVADTRGVHRGTSLQRGTRLQLVNVFVMNGTHDFAC